MILLTLREAHQLFLILLFTNSLAFGSFIRSVLWRLDPIEQTYAGAWCYCPGAISATRGHRCSDATLTALLKTNIHNSDSAGLSVVYYELVDLSILGGAGWVGWNGTTSPVGVRMSDEAPRGGAGNLKGRSLSVCCYSYRDNDHHLPFARKHKPKCIAAASQNACKGADASGKSAALTVLGAIA